MFELEPKCLWTHRWNFTMCSGSKWCLFMKKIKYIKNNVFKRKITSDHDALTGEPPPSASGHNDSDQGEKWPVPMRAWKIRVLQRTEGRPRRPQRGEPAARCTSWHRWGWQRTLWEAREEIKTGEQNHILILICSAFYHFQSPCLPILSFDL